jgi:bile acid-coenzyme A ligase
MGWVDDDGFLFIADRRRDLIVTGGANVFPAEVEAALSEHPAVGDQVVIGLPDDEWGHRVHAIIEPVDPAHAPDEAELRAFCKEHLASYKVPKAFEMIDRLPRTSAGKINRSALAEERSAAR